MGGDHHEGDHHGGTEAEDPIFVYELADPTAIAGCEPVIRRAIFEVLGVSDAARHTVNVSASSGWVTYHDRQGIWRAEPSPSIPTAAQARTRGDTFLRAVSAAIGKHRRELPEELQDIGWMPQARPVQLLAVPRTDGTSFDHWLYRLAPRLLARRGEPAIPVYGAMIEIRIDPAGTIVSYQARWRPPTGRRISRPSRAFVMPPTEHHDKHQHETPHTLVYYQEGDNIPQAHLSPYHLANTGHVLAVLGASDMSLVVDFVPKAVADGIEVCAVVAGGSGQGRFWWASRSADEVDGEVTDRGFFHGRTVEGEHGPAVATCKVQLPAGNHLLMVNVEDPVTGAFKHYAEMISGVPIVSTNAPLVA